MNFVRNEGNFHYELVGKTVVAHEGLTGQCALRIVTTYPDNYVQYRSLRPVWPMLPKYLAGTSGPVAGAVSALRIGGRSWLTRRRLAPFWRARHQPKSVPS